MTEYNHKIKELEQINLILKDLMEKEKSQIDEATSLENKIHELESAGIISEEFITKFKEQSNTFSKEEITDMHDKIRNPLVPIIGYTDMLVSGKFGKLSAEQLKRIQAVNTNAKTLNQVLVDILDKKTVD